MNTGENTSYYRQAAVNTFAVIGFIVLVGFGVYGAVYSARYVPTAANRIGSAAVYVGSLFVPAKSPTPPTLATTTPTYISFGTATTTTATSTPIKHAPVTTTKKPTTGTKIVTQISGSTASPALSGLPDLAITASAIGYLTTNSTDSFVASSSVPSGARPAIKFTVKNIGTNVSGTWRFSAVIPTRTSYTYYSSNQQTLSPSDSVDYVLGFDRANPGASQNITVNTNYDNAVKESNMGNNILSLSLRING